MKSNFLIVGGLVVGLVVQTRSVSADTGLEIQSSSSVVGSGVMANEAAVETAIVDRASNDKSAEHDQSIVVGESVLGDTVVAHSTHPDAHIPGHVTACESCGTECEWGGSACGPPNHGIDKAALRQKIGEKKHLHRLKGVTPRAAQYTHWWNVYHARMYPWHGAYYHRDWGSPVALVVPPTSAYQTKWSWGVGNTTVTPLYHQFRRANYGGQAGAMGGPQMQATPHWPSHTDQFGVYYVRGPW